MRIAFISGLESSGGAARAAVRLFDALAGRPGLELIHLVGRVDRRDSRAVNFAEPGMARGAVEDLARRFGRSHSSFLRRKRGEANRRNLLRLVREFRPDVISLHNLNPWCGLELSRIIAADLAEIAPVAWRMPDMWPVTGCCCYADYCENLARGCSYSPLVEALRAGREPAGSAAEERTRLLGMGKRLVLVSPSLWLQRIAREYFSNGLRVENILSGLDLDFWKPLDRTIARQALNLPTNGKILLFIADHIDLPLKGASMLSDALALLPGDARLVTAGNTSGKNAFTWPKNTLHLGRLQDDRLLRLAYAAADATVIPSLAENLPGVALESISCGTPCSGFAVGGIPDVVVPGLTGSIARETTPAALAESIQSAWTTPHHCRQQAELRFGNDRQVRQVLELFQYMVSP